MSQYFFWHGRDACGDELNHEKYFKIRFIAGFIKQINISISIDLVAVIFLGERNWREDE